MISQSRWLVTVVPYLTVAHVCLPFGFPEAVKLVQQPGNPTLLECAACGAELREGTKEARQLVEQYQQAVQELNNARQQLPY